MGVYTDAEDIRQHMRGGSALPVETLDELMDEQEYYVATVLKLDTLPANNPILASIIRDLTIAAAIYSLTAPNTDDLGKADMMRREALRKLQEADERVGLGTVGGSPRGSAELEVAVPSNTFFALQDFDQYSQLERNTFSPNTHIIRTRTETDGYR